MIYYAYEVDVVEKSKSSRNLHDATYSIVTPTPPTKNPELNMTVGINNYLEDKNTNTIVTKINNCEFIESGENIKNKYDYFYDKNDGDNRNILKQVKDII